VILVAGVGNIFLGDDAFGSEVARRMIEYFDTPNVRVIDFGIRGLDLAYALLDGYDASIIVDTSVRGGEPGTIYVVEPDLNELDAAAAGIEAHAMDPMRVLAVARSMGAELRNVRVVACEPETFGPDEGCMGLSPRVAASVERAIRVVETLIGKFVVREKTV
jgi:hydrogenase maturation protease